MTLKLVLLSALVFAVTGIPSPQYDDYGAYGSYGSNEYMETTAKTTKATTKTTTTKATTTKATTTKATTTKATTTTTSSTGKRIKFAYKKSPISGFKYTTVFGLHVFANKTKVSDAKFQHACGVMAAFLDNDQVRGYIRMMNCTHTCVIGWVCRYASNLTLPH